MDILDNIATELGFEFHLYIVQDELFGGKQKASKSFYSRSKETNDFLSKSNKNSDTRNSNTGPTNKNKKPGRKKGGSDDDVSTSPAWIVSSLPKKYFQVPNGMAS